MSVVYGISAIAAITNTPGTSGTSVVVSTGQGARFFSGSQSRRARIYEIATGTSEDVTITNRSSDTFTVTRNVDSRGAQSIASSGWIIEDLNDLGPFIALAYDAGFWLPQGGGTWLPANPAGVLRHAAQRHGYTLTYEVVAEATVSGTVSSIRVVLPTALAPNGAKARGGAWPALIFEAGTARPAYVLWAANDTYVTIAKTDGTNLAAGVVTINFQALIEVN